MKLTSNSHLLASLVDAQARAQNGNQTTQNKDSKEAGNAGVKGRRDGASENQNLKETQRAQNIEKNLEALKQTQGELRAQNIAKLREQLGLSETTDLATTGGVSNQNSSRAAGNTNRENFSAAEQPTFKKLGQIIDIRV